MYFVEPIVHLFAIRYLNMYVYSLFAKIILLDTIYSLKFLRSFFCSIIRALIFIYSGSAQLISFEINLTSSHPMLWLVSHMCLAKAELLELETAL